MPALPVTNINEGVKYYCDQLDFNCVYLDEGRRAVLQLGEAELHRWLTNEKLKSRHKTVDPPQK